MTQAQRAAELAADFARGLPADLGEITSDQPFVYENADYRRLFLRPADRLRSSLLATREILVLVAPFSDVQTRTIRAVTSQLTRAAAGRLEPAMAIVLHDDVEDGTRRLREWGREQGVTVLPISGIPYLPEGEQLEAALCEGLYAHDPFDVTGPVRAAHQFFGRSDVPDLARRVREGNIHALFGIRKIGKTSVLNQLLQEAHEHQNMACAMVDCSDDNVWSLNAGQLLYSIGGAVNDALGHSDSQYAHLIPLTTETRPSVASHILLDTLTRHGRPVLLMFDEIDYITPSSPLGSHWRGEFNVFFRALRQVYQECARRGIAFSIVICGVSSRWFAEEEIDGIENSALALVPEHYLPPFTTQQSVEMIQALGRGAGLIFTADAAAELARVCSGIPFWMRRAGSYVNSCYSHDERPVEVTFEDAQQLCREFVEVDGAQLAYSSLTHLFRIFPELGPLAIRCIDGADTSTARQHLLSVLGRYSILGDGTEASGPMIEAGLRQWERVQRDTQLELNVGANSSSMHKVEAGSASAAGEEQWAELLGEVAHRRNVLERKLREFIMIVVRAECNSRSNGRTPSDILLASIPSHRRDALQGKGVGALMKAMYWTDLVAIVSKNWPWFDRFFKDRKQFELQADIINDRPDAHAKDFDAAELALQRRAIGWMEGRIEDAGVL